MLIYAAPIEHVRDVRSKLAATDMFESIVLFDAAVAPSPSLVGLQVFSFFVGKKNLKF